MLDHLPEGIDVLIQDDAIGVRKGGQPQQAEALALGPGESARRVGRCVDRWRQTSDPPEVSFREEGLLVQKGVAWG